MIYVWPSQLSSVIKILLSIYFLLLNVAFWNFKKQMYFNGVFLEILYSKVKCTENKKEVT